MNMKTIFSHSTALSALAVVIYLTSASDSFAENISNALVKAYQSNPTLLSGQATLRSTDEGLSQALSGWRPSLNATASTSSKQFDNSSTRNTTHINPRTITLDVSQSLYAGGKTTAAISSAENAIKAQRARLISTEQNVLLGATTAYLNVLRDQHVLDLNVQNERILKRHLEATQNRFNVGEITKTDVYQARSRLAGATSARIQAEGTLASSRANYVNLIGEAPEKLEPAALPLMLPKTLDEALKTANERNPIVMAAVYDERVAADSIDTARGSLMPSIDLTGSANRSLDTISKNYWSNAMEAKVTLSVPLYQSGTVYSQLRQARQLASASRLATAQARRDATESVRKEWQNLQATRARIESIKSQVLAANTALEGVNREANAGSRTVLDVLDSEQELLNAEVNLVTSQRDEQVAALTLLSAEGKLTAIDLNLSVDLYDTDRHYQNVQGKWFGANIGAKSN